MSTIHDVIIVGAGFAGLRTAQLLQGHGFSICVLEARPRIGGRVLTTQLYGQHFDLGGQWVGPQQKRFHQLIQQLGFRTYSQYHCGTKLLSWQGKIRKFRGEIPWLSPLALLDLWRLEHFLDQAAKQIPSDSPWLAAQATEWDKQTLESWKQQFMNSKGGKLFLDMISRAVCTAEPQELSLLYFLSYLKWGNGLNTLINIRNGAQQDKIVGGVQQICQRMADKLEPFVHLDSAVTSISQIEDTVTVHCTRGSYCSQIVIVAIPPVLAGDINFQPALPLQRQILAREMPMGSFIKYVAVYAKPFWRESGFSGEVFSDTGPCTTTFDTCTFSGIPALVTFSDGAVAREYAKYTPEYRKSAVLKQFASFFGQQAATPLAYAEQNWLTEPWSRGCYAGIMGTGTMTRCGNALTTPFGRIHWAGTETATEWMGYIEGALQSAERVSQEILPLLRKRDCSRV